MKQNNSKLNNAASRSARSDKEILGIVEVLESQFSLKFQLWSLSPIILDRKLPVFCDSAF